MRLLKSLVLATLMSLIIHNAAWAGEIHIAAVTGDLDQIRALVADNPNIVGAVDEETGMTPLHYAVIGFQKGAVALLLSMGANPNVKDKDGRTPLEMAEIMGNKEIIDLLRKQGGKSPPQSPPPTPPSAQPPAAAQQPTKVEGSKEFFEALTENNIEKVKGGKK